MRLNSKNNFFENEEWVDQKNIFWSSPAERLDVFAKQRLRLVGGFLQSFFEPQHDSFLWKIPLRYTFLVLLIILILLSGCSAAKGNQAISGDFNRIVSTAPSNTEIIVDLKQAHRLVAIDKHSANVFGIPDDLPLLDFFFPDLEVIINLQPDLILASGHNPTGSGEDPFRLLREIGIPVVYISMSKSINDIYKDITLIAQLLQAGLEGEALIASMKEQISQIAAQTTADGENMQTVYFEISAAPQMMSFGKDSFINDMISVIGAQNIFENENWLVTPGAETIINRNPDVILTNVNYIEDPINEIKSRPGFTHINAVKNNRVYLIDNDSSSRPSSRVVLALRQMSEAVSSRN